MDRRHLPEARPAPMRRDLKPHVGGRRAQRRIVDRHRQIDVALHAGLLAAGQPSRVRTEASREVLALPFIWAQFVSDTPATRVLQRFMRRCHVLAKRRVDRRLIASAAGGVVSRAETCEGVVVQGDRDACLTRVCGKDCAPASSAEVILLLHRYSSSCRRSRRVAFRAEMIRTASPRQVYTTTMTRPNASTPRVHEALLGGRFVRNRDREDVVKYAHRTSEPDSVFAKIDRFLGGVPLGPHGILYAQVYIRSTSVSGRQERRPFARAPRSAARAVRRSSGGRSPRRRGRRGGRR